jgi:sugar phosphate permease
MEKSDKKQYLYIILSFFAYLTLYSARYSYTANYNPIIGEYGVPRAEVGLVSTFFFFSYAVSLVINGFFCKHYPKRFVIPAAMFLSSACTVSIFLGIPFRFFKWVWLINGIAQSFMWPTLIQGLGECIEDKHVGKSTLAMSSTASLGILIATGLSSLFTAIKQYKLIFLVCAIMMTTVATIWLFSFNGLYEKRKEKIEKASKENRKSKLSRAILLPIIMLVLFAIITNLIYDGLRPWTPVLIKETFNFSDSKSVMLTLLLPVVTFALLFLNPFLFKKVKDLILMNGIWFTIVALLIALAIPLL